MFPEAEFKEFEARLKVKTRLKYGWFHLKLYLIIQDSSLRSIETGFGGFKTLLKFIKFRLCVRNAQITVEEKPQLKIIHFQNH